MCFSSYLNSSVAHYLPSCSLCSQDACLLAVLSCWIVYGLCTYNFAASTVFILFPQDIRSCDSILTFYCLLKTFIFVMPSFNTSDVFPCLRFNVLFVDNARIMKLNTYLLTYLKLCRSSKPVNNNNNNNKNTQLVMLNKSVILMVHRRRVINWANVEQYIGLLAIMVDYYNAQISYISYLSHPTFLTL